jgi:hypothetical protein
MKYQQTGLDVIKLTKDNRIKINKVCKENTNCIAILLSVPGFLLDCLKNSNSLPGLPTASGLTSLE